MAGCSSKGKILSWDKSRIDTGRMAAIIAARDADVEIIRGVRALVDLSQGCKDEAEDSYFGDKITRGEYEIRSLGEDLFGVIFVPSKQGHGE